MLPSDPKSLMFPAHYSAIRPATEADPDALRRLAALDSRAPLTGRVLIGEIDDPPGRGRLARR